MPTTPSSDAAGETINYTITVDQHRQHDADRCCGERSECRAAPTLVSGDTASDNDILEVGETWAYTAAYAVTQAELERRRRPGEHGDGRQHQTGRTPTTPRCTVAQTPALNIVKEAVPGQIADVAGETLNYTITVANTGNTTLTGVVVTDPNADAGSIVRGADVVGDNDALLEVGETWAYTAAHTVTQAEIDSNGGGDGDIDNMATADSDQTGPDTDDATVPVAQTPALNIVKDGGAGADRRMWRARRSTTRSR